MSDVDHDGRDELWVDDGGNTALWVFPALLEGCEVRRQTTTGGDLVSFMYEATQAIAGLQCTDVDGDGEMEVVTFIDDLGDVYQWTAANLSGEVVASGDTRDPRFRWRSGGGCERPFTIPPYA